jgi:hypothetical protein
LSFSKTVFPVFPLCKFSVFNKLSSHLIIFIGLSECSASTWSFAVVYISMWDLSFFPLTVSLLSGSLDKTTLTVVLEYQDLSVISSILIRTHYTPLLSPIHAACPIHLILFLNLITRIIFVGEYRSFSSTLCSFLHYPIYKTAAKIMVLYFLIFIFYVSKL